MIRRLPLLAASTVLASGCGAGTIVGPTSDGKLLAPPTGNATAGKIVFEKNTCAACHTFAPAGSTAKIGPSLDNLAAYAQKASQPLGDFVQSAITKPPAAYVPPGFPTNAMPTNFGATLSAQDLANLVAFLTQGH